jgi:hypothetical protein
MIAGLRPVFIAEITHSPRINLGVLTRTESFIYISDLSRPAEDLNQYGVPAGFLWGGLFYSIHVRCDDNNFH